MGGVMGWTTCPGSDQTRACSSRAVAVPRRGACPRSNPAATLRYLRTSRGCGRRGAPRSASGASPSRSSALPRPGSSGASCPVSVASSPRRACGSRPSEVHGSASAPPWQECDRCTGVWHVSQRQLARPRVPGPPRRRGRGPAAQGGCDTGGRGGAGPRARRGERGHAAANQGH